MTAGTILVIAKEPRPGRVKTRLTSRYTATEAAAIAEACLRDTLAAVMATPAARRVLVLDGAPGDWTPPDIDIVAQVDGGLDVRLAAAFAEASGPTVLVGMDTPQLTPALLADALATLADHDACLGRADDGGWWALGMARPDPAAFPGVPMSRSDTGDHQLRRLHDLGLGVVELPVLRDVDHPDDLRAVAAEAPGTAFAAMVSTLVGAEATA